MTANNIRLSSLAVPAVPIASVRPRTRKRFITNTVTVFGAQLGRAGISLLLEIVYARFLGPSGRGQISLCLMVLGCGVLVGGLGGEIPIMLWAADERRRSFDWLPSVLLCGFFGSLLACGLWAFLFWWWHPPFLQGISNSLALILLLSLPFSVLGTYSLAMLVGLERLQERSFLIILSQFTTLVSAVVLLLFVSKTAEVALTAVFLGLLVALVAAARLLNGQVQFKKLTGVFSKVGQALNLGIRGQLGNVATFFNYRLDVFVVNYYLNTTEVGLYALGVMISEAIWQFPNAAAMALVPRTARAQDEAGASFTCLVCRQVFALACASAVVLALLSPWLIPIAFGARFAPSIAVIWLILPGTVCLAVSKVMCADLMARGIPEYSTIFAFVALIVTVALDLVLIPRMGINGAAIASSTAYLVNSVAIGIVLKRKLGVSWRALYVPSMAELASYRQIWNRFTSWLRPNPIV